MAKKKSKPVKLPAVTAEEKVKERIGRKNKKEKKHDPSSDKKERGHKFFNNMPKIIRRDLLRELNTIADRYDVAHIDLENSAPYPDWSARDWSWRSSFFVKYLREYENTIDYTLVDHYRWWLDQLINQCSVMIWNLVQKTMKDDYKKTNVVPVSPLSKKKGRDSIAAVSEYFADKEVMEFEEMFK